MRIVWPVPQVDRFYISAGFLDPNYPQWRKSAGLPPAEHTGIDLNLKTRGDTDLGYPVVAIADGRVVHARFHRVWGNIVLVEHDHPKLGKFFSQYAHLAHVVVEEGYYLWAGEPIGSIGKGDPTRPFVAHLHFEIRKASIPADFWPGMNRKYIQENYIDPKRFLSEHFAPQRVLFRPALTVAKQKYANVLIDLTSSEMAEVRTK